MWRTGSAAPLPAEVPRAEVALLSDRAERIGTHTGVLLLSTLDFGKHSLAIRVRVGVAIALTLDPASLGAQTSSGSPPGYREYLALLRTPIASLPPLATYTFFGIAQNSPEIVARYGYISDITEPLAPETGGHAAHSLDGFGLTGVMPTGLGGTFYATLGLANERCAGCSTASFTASIGTDYRILTTPINQSDTHLTLAMNGEIGYGNPNSGTAFSADIGFPLAFRIGDGSAGTSIIPFVTPSIAFVTSNGGPDPDVHSGRLLIGGGVSLFNPKSPIGGNVGFQYVFVSHTQVQVGVALSYGGR